MVLRTTLLIKVLITCSLVLAFVKPILCQKSLSLAVFAPQTLLKSNDQDTSIEGGSDDHDVSVHADEVDYIIQSIRLAAQDINNRQDLLHGYQIQLDIRDTKCNIGYAIKELFEIVQPSSHPCFMLIGADCDRVSQQLAVVSKFWNLLTVSYGSTTPSLSNRLHYSYFFRTIPTDSLYYRAYLAILHHFNWTSVSILQERHDETVADRFRYTLTRNNISVQGFIIFDTDTDDSFQKLKATGSRIFLAHFDEYNQESLICSIYRYKLYGKNYAWILTPHSNVVHPSADKKFVHNCTQAQLSEALEGIIIIEYFPVSPFNDVTVSGMTVEQLSQRLLNVQGSKSLQNRSPYAYDSMWAAALVLNKTRQFYLETYNEDILETFQYNRVDLRQKLMEYMETTSFIGISGPLGFARDGDRKGIVMINQAQNNASITVGYYNDIVKQINTSGYPSFQWKGGNPPVDRQAQIRLNRVVDFKLYFALSIAAACGVVIGIFFMIINTVFQNQRYIRLTNPGINNVLIFGVILGYGAVPLLETNHFHGFSTSVINMFCMLRYWLLLMGGIIPYAVILAKMWRTYVVVTNIVRAGKETYEVAMVLVMTVIIAIATGILILWNILDPIHAQERITTTRDGDGNLLQFHRTVCSCKTYLYFLGSLYGYFALLVLCGVYLAKETHQISSLILTDAKWISISAVNYSLYVVAAPIGFFAGLNAPDVNFAVLALTILYISTSTLFIIFIPAVIAVCKYRSLTITEVAGIANGEKSETKEIISLGIENISIQQRINAQDVEIEKLKSQILQARKLRGEDSKFYIPKKHFCKVSSITLGGTQTSIIKSYQSSQEGSSLPSTIKNGTEIDQHESLDQPVPVEKVTIDDNVQDNECIELQDISQPFQEVEAVVEINNTSRHSDPELYVAEEVAPVILRHNNEDENDAPNQDRYSLLRNEELLNEVTIIDAKNDKISKAELEDVEYTPITIENEQKTSNDSELTSEDDCFDHSGSDISEQVFDQQDVNSADEQVPSDMSESNPKQKVTGRSRQLSYINDDGIVTSDV